MGSRGISVVAIALSAALSFPAGADVAGASPRGAPTYQPDGVIAGIGQDVYNTDSNVQMQNKYGLKPGSTFISRVSLGNDGTSADSFSLTNAGGSQRPYTVSYWKGTKDITKKVLAGTYVTATVQPGAATLIRIRFDIAENAKHNAGITTPLPINSVGDGTIDAVSVCLWTK